MLTCWEMMTFRSSFFNSPTLSSCSLKISQHMLYYMPYSRLIFTWLIFWVHFVKHFQPEVKTGEHHKMLYSSRPIKTLHYTLSYNNHKCRAPYHVSNPRLISMILENEGYRTGLRQLLQCLKLTKNRWSRTRDQP